MAHVLAIVPKRASGTFELSPQSVESHFPHEDFGTTWLRICLGI